MTDLCYIGEDGKPTDVGLPDGSETTCARWGDSVLARPWLRGRMDEEGPR